MNDMIPTLPGGLVIAANAAEIERLRTASVGTAYRGAVFIATTPGEPLPRDIVDSARVLVIEVDPEDDVSLRRVGGIRAERPDLAIIAALAKADVSLVRTLIRQGVSDVATLPFEPVELASQILDASAKSAGKESKVSLAPMFSIVRGTGGCGTSTVLTHLAAALQEDCAGSKGVCIVDLDLQGGDIAPLLGVEPKVTVASLLDAGDRLDADLVQAAVTRTRHDFSLIAAPEMIEPLDTVDVDYLLRALALVRQQFDIVLLDLPANWTNWALSTALASTRVLLVTDLSIASLRQAKRKLQLLSSIGLEKDKVEVVVNRLERRLFKAIGVEEAEEALNHHVLAGLANEGAAIRGAQDQGLLIEEIESRSRFARDIRALAAQLCGQGG
ncbi:P-loop NTPase [Novosphingobium sp. ZN18A2]|uniref:AAA family ATPase n=1 Tax=Novosphingobium sp. ZN18A2 TaxID=3079861 RepID=UPI0030D1DED4